MLRLVAAAALSLLCLPQAARGAPPPPSPPALPPHPRLILTPARVASLRALIASDVDANNFFVSLRMHADWVQTQPPIPQGPPGPSGVLIPVRNALDAALSCAAVAVLLDAPTATPYLDRAVAELLSLVSWTTWNPPHFLDVAEATTAVSLGYDWLYPQLNASTRAALVAGITRLGMAPYNASFVGPALWPVKSTSNWNCVCSSGAILGTLATLGDADAFPGAWTAVLLPALDSIPPCIGSYGAEGSWEEGIGYWGYSTKYNAFAITALDTATGDDYGLAETPGLDRAGRFPIFTSGASGAFFDWADSWAYVVIAYGDVAHAIAPYQGFFGLRFNDSATNYFSRRYSALFANASLATPTWAGLVETLLYYSPQGSAADLAALPPAQLYVGIHVGAFCGGAAPWAVGVPEVSAPGSSLHFKGGDTAFGHGHLDLGTFVFDLRGVRIVEDLAADNYNLPDYFGPTRWHYARLNSLLHNVPRFDGRSHDTSARATISVFNFSAELLRAAAPAAPPLAADVAGAAVSAAGFAVTDLSSGYVHQAPTQGALTALRRGWAVLGAGAPTALVVDELTWAAGGGGAGNVSNATFSLHTRGVVTLDESGLFATIALNSTGGHDGPLVAAATVALLPAAVLAGPGGGCPGARLIVESIALPPPQYDTPGLVRVSAMVQGGDALAACTRVAVAVGDPLPADGWTLAPLAAWQAAGPIAPAAGV